MLQCILSSDAESGVRTCNIAYPGSFIHQLAQTVVESSHSKSHAEDVVSDILDHATVVVGGTVALVFAAKAETLITEIPFTVVFLSPTELHILEDISLPAAPIIV